MLNDNFILNRLNLGAEPTQPDVWQKLTDYYNKISSDQRLFVENHEAVITAQRQMLEAFSLFLFTKFKNEMSQEATFRKFCDTYVDTVIATGETYQERISAIVDENEMLKARIAELEGKSNE